MKIDSLLFYLNMVKRANQYKNHLSRQFFYLLKNRGLRNAMNYFWAMAFSKEEGAGLLDKLYIKNPNLAPYPERIELEVTTKCALRCPKCEHTYWDQKEKNMKYEDFIKIMKQFPKLKAISLSGIGHSFHNPDFIKMVKYVKSKGIYTQFFDPFYLINEERARELIRLGVDKIWMSIDGATKEVYEYHQKGSKFETVIENVKRMVELKEEMKSPFPEIAFHFITTDRNYKQIPQFIDLVHDIVGDRQTLTTIQCTKLLPFKENLHLYPKKIPREIIEEARKRARKYGNFRLDIFNFYEEELPHLKCCTAWTVPFITVDGTYYPCCTLTEGNIRSKIDPYCENLFKRDYKDIWKSKEFRRFVWRMHKGIAPRICWWPIPCKIYDIKGCKRTDD